MPGKSKRGGGLTSSPVYKKQAYGTAKSPFMMKASPFAKNKEEKVTTTMNPDGTITKSKGGKSSTYTVDPKNPKRYSNPKGGEFFMQ